MNTSVQAYNHSSVVLIAHSMKNYYLKPILDNTVFIKGHKNFIGLVENTLGRMSNSGGVFHLWGHSWEIEEQGLWNELEMTFNVITSYSIHYTKLYEIPYLKEFSKLKCYIETEKNNKDLKIHYFELKKFLENYSA